MIVTGRALLREGITSLLQNTPYKVVFGSAGTAELEGLRLPKGRRVLTIVGMDGKDGVPKEAADNVRRLRSRLPDAKIVVIAETNGPVDLESIVALDADGYILNLGSRDILLKALELTLLDQQVFVLGSHIAKPADRPDARSLELGGRTYPGGSDGPGADAMQLSDRERQVLGSLAHGRSNKAIARLCQLSEATVKVHLKAILRKTNTRNRTQAAIWALRHQFREPAVAEVAKPADPPKSAAAESIG